MKIKQINITPARSDKGLVAFANIITCDDILLQSIAIYKKKSGGYRLLYPSKKTSGVDFALFHPVSRDASAELEHIIIQAYLACERRV